MKKMIAFILALVCMLGFVGCNASKDNHLNETSVYFIAKVTEVKEGYLFVEVTNNGSTSLREGTTAHVSTNFDGYTECVVGDNIRIEFDGLMQEVYPPIIPNVIAISKENSDL